MSSCFSPPPLLLIAMPAFYELSLWIKSVLWFTYPDLHHGLLGDLREVPCFRWPTFSTCRPPRPREAHRLHASSSFPDDAGLRNACETLGASHPPTLRFS